MLHFIFTFIFALVTVYDLALPPAIGVGADFGQACSYVTLLRHYMSLEQNTTLSTLWQKNGAASWAKVNEGILYQTNSYTCFLPKGDKELDLDEMTARASELIRRHGQVFAGNKLIESAKDFATPISSDSSKDNAMPTNTTAAVVAYYEQLLKQQEADARIRKQGEERQKKNAEQLKRAAIPAAEVTAFLARLRLADSKYFATVDGESVSIDKTQAPQLAILSYARLFAAMRKDKKRFVVRYPEVMFDSVGHVSKVLSPMYNTEGTEFQDCSDGHDCVEDIGDALIQKKKICFSDGIDGIIDELELRAEIAGILLSLDKREKCIRDFKIKCHEELEIEKALGICGYQSYVQQDSVCDLWKEFWDDISSNCKTKQQLQKHMQDFSNKIKEKETAKQITEDDGLVLLYSTVRSEYLRPIYKHLYLIQLRLDEAKALLAAEEAAA